MVYVILIYNIVIYYMLQYILYNICIPYPKQHHLNYVSEALLKGLDTLERMRQVLRL